MAPPGQPETISATADVTLHVSVVWVPTGTLAQDPAPKVLRVTETGNSSWYASGYNDSTSKPITGTGTANLTGVVSGTTQYSMPDGFPGHDVTFHGKASLTLDTTSSGTPVVQIFGNPVGQPFPYRQHEQPWISVSPSDDVGASGSVSTSFSYSIRAEPIGGTIAVDQDQQIFAPAATTPLSATASVPTGFTLDSMKIRVDGQALTATVTGDAANGYHGAVNWPQTGGNPSEHTITATAQIHDSIGSLTLYSMDLPSRPYATGGVGQPADDIIADLRLKSLEFKSASGGMAPLKLRTQADSVDSGGIPVDGTIPVPQVTWDPTTNIAPLSPKTSHQAGYIMGSKPELVFVLCQPDKSALSGTATVGLTAKVTAHPNTGDADIVFKNTGSTPVSTMTLDSDNPLLAKVSSYATTFSSLGLYVKFTKVPVPYWRSIRSYSSFGNTLYGVLSTPKAPMDQPWVGVLDKACDWAKGTTDATSATTALTKGFYNNANYQPGYTGYTTFENVNDTIVRDFKVNAFISSGMAAPCYDFAAFMVCLSNSLGATSLQMQTQGSKFTSQKVTRANLQTGTGSSYTFLAHAWANGNGKIFDGALKFGGTTYPANLSGPDVNTAYYNGLVLTPPTTGWSDGLSIPYGVKAVN